MKKTLIILVALTLIMLMPAIACQTNSDEIHTPIPSRDIGIPQTEQEAPDDIMPVPGGGPAYRANVHQQGEVNPWPSIEVSEAYLGSGDNEAHIYYRSHIETAAGETRNNVIKAIIPDKEVQSLNLYSNNTPQDIILFVGMQWSGPSARASVLVIEIANDIVPGEFPLEIGLEINGKDYGTITCTINVIAEETRSQETLRLDYARPYLIIGEANLVNEDPDRTTGLWLITSEEASGFEEYARTAAQAVLDLYNRYGRDFTSVKLIPCEGVAEIDYAHAAFAADGRGPAGMTGSAPASAFYWKVRAASRELNEQEMAIAKLWSTKQQDFPQTNPLSSLSYDEEALRLYISDTLNIPYDEVQMPGLEMREYALDQSFIDGTISPTAHYIYGNHGITTTKVEPHTGTSGVSISALMVKLTLEDLIENSDAIVIGKVVDIFPSRQADWVRDNMIITDVIIEVERDLYGSAQSPYIAVVIPGGQIGDIVMWVEDQPVFHLDEEVVLFLHSLEPDIMTLEGFDRAECFHVTGNIQGKLEYRNGAMFTLDGNPVTITEIERLAQPD